MNRFATFAVLALAALALSTINSAPVLDQDLDSVEKQTQFSLATSDDEETSAVEAAGLEIFSDFCKSSRDHVLGDIKAKTGEMSSQGFSAFFQMAEEVAKQALAVQQDATKRLSQQLADPSLPVEGDGQVADAQRQIADQSQPIALMTAVRTALAATMSAVSTVVSQKFETAKTWVSLQRWITIAEGGCEQAAVYETDLKNQFEEYKRGFTGAAANQFAALPLDAIPCVTSSRIVRANGICGFVRVSVEPSKKMLASYFNRQAIKDAVAERN